MLNKLRQVSDPPSFEEIKKYFDDYVVRSFEDFKNNQADEYKAKIACLFAFHFSEHFYWFKNRKELKNFNERKKWHGECSNAVEEYRIIQTVANTAKHFSFNHLNKDGRKEKINSRAVVPEQYRYYTNDAKTDPYFIDDNCQDPLFSKYGVFINFKGKQYCIFSSAEKVFNYWKEKLNAENN